jgi:hypothetical protein
LTGARCGFKTCVLTSLVGGFGGNQMKLNGTEVPGAGAPGLGASSRRLAVRRPTEGLQVTSSPISLLSESPWRILVETPLTRASLELHQRPALEFDEDEGCAEHSEECSYLEWFKQNKEQRDFLSKKIQIMMNEVRLKQDPEELALLLGKIAYFEGELSILEERAFRLRDDDSDHKIPSHLTENIWEKGLCEFAREAAEFKRRADCSSGYAYYRDALYEVSTRLRSQEVAWTGVDRRSKPPKVSTPAPVKKRSIRSSPATGKKAPAKLPGKHGSISIVVKY